MLRFGVFEVDLQESELRRSGLRQKLGPQPFELLRALLERPGEIVTRDELRQRLWPGDTYVDYELGLKKCVNRVREVLGDSADHPRYIETVPRRGYRFIAPAEQIDGFSAGTRAGQRRAVQIVPGNGNAAGGLNEGAVSLEAVVREQSARISRGRVWQISVAAGLILVVLSVSVLLMQRYAQHRRAANSRPALEPIVVPLLSLGGEQSTPAFSPDSSRVAFRWYTPKRDERGIYAVVAGTQSLLRLTQDANDYSPAWSPNGREVAFLRDEGEQFHIGIVPALGGASTTIYTGPLGPLSHLTDNAGLSFSPDGKLLAFSEWNTAQQRAAIKLLSLEDSRARFLTSPPDGLHDRRPAFSPAGDRVAFIRSSGPVYIDELFVISKDGGKPKQLTFDHKRIFGPPAWTPDGEEIVFSSSRAGLEAIWRISSSGGVPRRVPGAGPIARYPSMSPSSSELAYEHVDEEQNLCRLELMDATHARGAGSVLVSSAKTFNFVPQFSPDGRDIVFQASRSGYSELWVCRSDGSNLVQLTALEAFAGSPRWSPDGRYLAFDCRPRQHSEIHVREMRTERTHAVVAFPDADNVIPSWSRDGKWIYFASNRGKVFQIWKVAVTEGVATPIAPVQVTTNGGFAAFESVDGKQLFYTKPTEAGIWTVTPDGGRERPVWPGPGPDYWSNWAPAKDGLYFLTPDGELPPDVAFLDFKTKRLTRIAKLQKPSFYGLTVSPDGRSLVYSQWERNEHDILIMKNFR